MNNPLPRVLKNQAKFNMLSSPDPLSPANPAPRQTAAADHFFKKIRRLSKNALGYILLLALFWTMYIFAYGNFHRVDKDFYRSAQLFSFNMPHYIQKNGIKSVLNLRGPSKDDWYKDELEILGQYNVVHYNYRIGDRKRLTKKQMDDLVDIIDKAPKPILVHCKAGADRASLATALYLHAIKRDKDPEKAFSLMYGHFPWLGSKTKAMDESFEYYKQEGLKEDTIFVLERAASD